jgi:hypothetical protein
MKKYFELKNIIISILLVVIVIILLNPKGCLPGRTKTITVSQTDTLYYEIHDTIPIETEVEVEIEVPVEIIKETKIEVPVIQTVDTVAIVKMFSDNKQFKKDVLELPGNIGTVTLYDTISNNRVLGRSFTSKVKQKIVRDTIKVTLPPRNLLYFGLETSFNSPDLVNNIGFGIMYKTKSEKIFKVMSGVTNRTIDGVNGTLSPYIGGGVYWKIDFKKK